MRKKNNIIDGKLVTQYNNGDEKALATLVKRWHKRFCKQAYWLVKDTDVAKDIAQESWQVIIHKTHSLKDPQLFGTWALRIVSRKSLDTIQQKIRERKQQQEYKAVKNIEAIPEQDTSELKKKVLKAIQELPKHQQHIITLFYVNDYTLKEIADVLEISVGTVKSRLFHAREKLKKIIRN